VTTLKRIGKRVLPARARERRDEIVRGASAVLRERRNGALRMDHVAERVGLVKGNIYYYFRDRQDLIYHCHLRCIEMSLEALEEISGRRASAEERLRALLERHIEIIIASDYGGVLLADMDELKPAQRRRYVALRDRFEAGVRKLVEAGIAGGEFRPSHVPLAGFAMLGAINWMPKWHRRDGKLEPRAIAQWFADFFIRALKP
jgi:TetR/AcrR family transcriptional regulator, cholesterol catabolism regulator